MTISVVVADDQELARSGFVMILDAQPDISVVAEAADGRAAIEAVRDHTPDVALLDIRMPNLDGIEAAKEICARFTTKVLVLTTFNQDDYVYGALHAGASGFLLKDVRRDDLVHAVRVVHAGESLLAPAVTRRLIDDVVGRRSHPPPEPGGLGDLTTRERDVLTHLGRGLSNPEIATALALSEHTVKTHVSNVLTKLGLRDRTQAVIHAYETGLIRPGSP